MNIKYIWLINNILTSVPGKSWWSSNFNITTEHGDMWAQGILTKECICSEGEYQLKLRTLSECKLNGVSITYLLLDAIANKNTVHEIDTNRRTSTITRHPALTRSYNNIYSASHTFLSLNNLMRTNI